MLTEGPLGARGPGPALTSDLAGLIALFYSRFRLPSVERLATKGGVSYLR